LHQSWTYFRDKGVGQERPNYVHQRANHPRFIRCIARSMAPALFDAILRGSPDVACQEEFS